MTITTKDVETRLRAALDATIPQLLSEETQLSRATDRPVWMPEESQILALARSEPVGSRSWMPGWRLVGAAAAGVVLVGGLAIAQRPQGEPAPVGQSPISAPSTQVSAASTVPTVAELSSPALEPDVYPVVPETYPNAELASAMWGGQLGWNASPSAEALVARLDGNTLTDGIQLSVHSDSAEAFAGEAQAAQVAGISVEVYVENGSPALTTVVLPGSPALAVTGQDPIRFLEDAGGFPIAGARIDSTGAVTFAVGTLPAGYEVIVPPSQLPIGSVDASTRVPDDDGGDGLAVWVEVRNPLISWAQAGQLTRVDVNGTTGWMIDSGPGSPVIWPASPTTWALVSGATNADIALEFARSVEFVDNATWTQRYDVEPTNFPPQNDQISTADVPATSAP